MSKVVCVNDCRIDDDDKCIQLDSADILCESCFAEIQLAEMEDLLEVAKKCTGADIHEDWRV